MEEILAEKQETSLSSSVLHWNCEIRKRREREMRYRIHLIIPTYLPTQNTYIHAYVHTYITLTGYHPIIHHASPRNLCTPPLKQQVSESQTQIKPNPSYDVPPLFPTNLLIKYNFRNAERIINLWFWEKLIGFWIWRGWRLKVEWKRWDMRQLESMCLYTYIYIYMHIFVFDWVWTGRTEKYHTHTQRYISIYIIDIYIHRDIYIHTYILPVIHFEFLSDSLFFFW